MQILGKKSKVLLIAVAITMLVTVGVSFAMWDTMSVVKATTGNVSYSTAKVGDVIQYGKYYQTDLKDETTGEYEKTPIDWLVVDKDERTGQITLMSKYILAAGSYFGNFYFSATGEEMAYYTKLTGPSQYNQAYADSTVRAYLNNLVRRDLGGDQYVSGVYMPSALFSTAESGLLSNIGFSNKQHFNGMFNRKSISKFYVDRPIAKGFYDEAFTPNEKSLIVPKTIAAYSGFRWPVNASDLYLMDYVDGAVDKVWLPSVTELGGDIGDSDSPNDDSSSTVFEYFKQYQQYDNPYTGIKNTNLNTARRGLRTALLETNSIAGNSSIPVFKRESMEVNTDIHITKNASAYYWTRTPSSHSFSRICFLDSTGKISYANSDAAYFGIRPCIIIKF